MQANVVILSKIAVIKHENANFVFRVQTNELFIDTFRLSSCDS